MRRDVVRAARLGERRGRVMRMGACVECVEAAGSARACVWDGAASKLLCSAWERREGRKGGGGEKEKEGKWKKEKKRMKRRERKKERERDGGDFGDDCGGVGHACRSGATRGTRATREMG